MSTNVIGLSSPIITPIHNARRATHLVDKTTDRKFTVFIVDDDLGVLRALARLVRVAGYAARTFSSAIEYLEKQEADIPGCLVLDFLMPDLDGRQLQAALFRENASRPIIFMSGTNDVPTAVATKKAGAIDFLIKPITHEVLLRAITAAVEQEAKSCQQRINWTASPLLPTQSGSKIALAMLRERK
jgi:FixJ family two-component response regulator